MFAFSSILLGTWESMTTTIGIALVNGGTAGMFWNFVIGAVFISFIYASLSEMASMQVFLALAAAPFPPNALQKLIA